MGLAADLAFCNKKLEALFVDILSSQNICRSLLKTLLTALSNLGNSSSVRFLCYRNIILFNGYRRNTANPLNKNNEICLESK